MSKTRIYMDNCCYNRPYDDQIQARIHVEAQAKLEIQNMVRMGKLELASSFVLEFENKVNPKEDRRIPIADFLDTYAMVFVAVSKKPEIVIKASKFQEQGIKYKDAYHIACAILGGCDYFLSTDDRLLKCKAEEIEIINPMEFIRIMEA